VGQVLANDATTGTAEDIAYKKNAQTSPVLIRSLAQ
jgi:hypothetical protein